MTNEEVKNGFAEVYNNFWNKYKDRVPDKDSEEWERMRTYSVVLQKRFPFLKDTVILMELEFDRRIRQ